jgi:hypothetical protein
MYSESYRDAIKKLAVPRNFLPRRGIQQRSIDGHASVLLRV